MDSAFLDLLYPPRCIICDKAVSAGVTICPACQEKVHAIKEPMCMKCGKQLSNLRKEFCKDCEEKKHYFVQGKSLWIYETDVKKSIYRFKYQNKREYAKGYAEEIAKQYGSWIRKKKIQAVIPVPLYKKKQRKRGYNQAQVLAKELGRIWDLPVYTDWLIRIRDTKPQKMLNNTERKNNMKKAFKTTENIVQLEQILLVDDIYTTGSTLDAAAETLLEAGVREVYVCCISTGKDS